MVAFGLSLAVALGSIAGALLYMKRRPVGASLTWGEAMLAAAFTYFVLFLSYGVVPHQWLFWSDNELGFRSDRLLLGPGQVFAKLPFELNYQVLRDVIVSIIYGVFLTLQVMVWAVWQKRGKARPAGRKELDRSAFGRPLVKLVKSP